MNSPNINFLPLLYRVNREKKKKKKQKKQKKKKNRSKKENKKFDIRKKLNSYNIRNVTSLIKKLEYLKISIV